MTASWVAALVSATNALGQCTNACGDLNGDGVTNLDDFAAFEICMGEEQPFSQDCVCADLEGNDRIDLGDFVLFSRVFGKESDELPPDCTGAVGSTGNITAYRPQHGTGYFPFSRTAVPDGDEDDVQLGPGIRLNAPGDADPSGEDDLIELRITVDPPGAPLALRRSDQALRVWTTRTKAPGTELDFLGDKTESLPWQPTDTAITLWVEWASPIHGVADLVLEPVASPVVKDVITFHTFTSIIMALGGEDQSPSVPVDPGHGTFVLGIDLYEQGYDVWMYDEDNVGADGAGIVYDQAVTAIQDRGVGQVAIFGYSHGGGSTYDLAERLDNNRGALEDFEIAFTSYADAVSNNSDIDLAQELRRPPSTLLHVNHYQVGSLFEDFFLDGGPVPDSIPAPTGLNVETTPWGAGATHFDVDDYAEVRDLIESSLTGIVNR